MYENPAQFFTATILEWKHLLKPDKYKELIASSLGFLVRENRALVHGFVIMPNHIHLIWRITEAYKREDVQRDFLKFTAQKIRFDLIQHHPEVLKTFEVECQGQEVSDMGAQSAVSRYILARGAATETAIYSS